MNCRAHSRVEYFEQSKCSIAAEKRKQILENMLVNMCCCLAASIIKPFSSKNVVVLCISELLTSTCRVNKAQITRKYYLYFAVSKFFFKLPMVLKTDFERRNDDFKRGIIHTNSRVIICQLA